MLVVCPVKSTLYSVGFSPSSLLKNSTKEVPTSGARLEQSFYESLQEILSRVVFFFTFSLFSFFWKT